MRPCEQEVIEKFEADLPVLQRPSVSSSMIINLDETLITDAIREVIVSHLTAASKRFKKIAFVGVDRRHWPSFDIIHHDTGAALAYFDDYEKAKEWVL